MVDPAVYIALIALLGSVSTPFVISIISSRSKLAEAQAARLLREEDLERQDLVARRLEENTRELANTNGRAAVERKQLETKMDTVHLLINSGKTADMKARRDSAIREVAALESLIAIKKKLNEMPTKADLDAVEAAKLTIKDLTAELAVRVLDAEKVEAQQKSAVIVAEAKLAKGTPTTPIPVKVIAATPIPVDIVEKSK